METTTKQNQCLIDAITISYRGITADDLICNVLHLGGLEWQRLDYGRYGYHAQMVLGSIRILHDGTPQMGICLELLGAGCRELEQLCQRSDVFYMLLTTEYADTIHLTRIDIAIDDYQKLLDMTVVEHKVHNDEIATYLQNRTVYKGLNGTAGHTVYLGSRSRYMLRIYDKAAEQRTSYKWVRVELEIRHDAALEFKKLVTREIDQTSTEKDAAIARFGVGVIANKLRFIERTDSNKTRCKTSIWWEQLLNGVKPIELTLERKMPLDMGEAIEWLKKQIAPTMALLTAYLGPSVIETLIHEGLYNIDKQKAKRWAQELEASGILIPAEIKLDGKVKTEEVEKVMQKQIGEHFCALDSSRERSKY